MAKSSRDYLKELELLAFTRKSKDHPRGATMVKKHRSVSGRCTLCGGTHTLKEHKSHGVGAYDRIHPGQAKRKARKAKRRSRR